MVEHTVNSNGPRAFAGVVAIVAVILGVYAMVEPMSQKIELLQNLLEKQETEIALVRSWMAAHDQKIEKRDAEQWGEIRSNAKMEERIKYLERMVFSK